MEKASGVDWRMSADKALGHVAVLARPMTAESLFSPKKREEQKNPYIGQGIHEMTAIHVLFRSQSMLTSSK